MARTASLVALLVGASALVGVTGCGTGEGDAVSAPSIAGTGAPDGTTVLRVSCGKPNSRCDDGNPCTKNDACVDHLCKGTPYSCDDDNVCTADSCDGAGGCTHVAISGSCDDGNPCSQNDTCIGGACKGTPYSCDDGNPCTADACDGAGGCLHTPISASCSDGNACTFGDTCSGGTCSGTAYSCDDGDPCTADACDGAGGCTHTFDDTCSGGTCGGAYSCDDGDPCTADACDGAGGCTHTPAPSCPSCPTTEICDNGIDDDCNGLVDWADPACAGCIYGDCFNDPCNRGYICDYSGCCYPHCGDGYTDGDESDVDCGGSCGANCLTGQQCSGFWDCASGVCVRDPGAYSGVCQ